jgi:hypothetical protein
MLAVMLLESRLYAPPIAVKNSDAWYSAYTCSTAPTVGKNAVSCRDRRVRELVRVVRRAAVRVTVRYLGEEAEDEHRQAEVEDRRAVVCMQVGEGRCERVSRCGAVLEVKRTLGAYDCSNRTLCPG